MSHNSHNSSIFIENLQQASQNYIQNDEEKKSKLCQIIAQRILTEIDKKRVLRDNQVNFKMAYKGVIYDNGQKMSIPKYVSRPEFYAELTNIVQLTGSSAISVQMITAYCDDCLNLPNGDHVMCSCCCPCIYLPYMLYRSWHGHSYDFVVKLEIRNI